MNKDIEKAVRVRVAELISQQYKARGVSRQEFAEQLGLSDRMLGYWAAGTSMPKADAQKQIEELFGWPRGAIAGAIAEGLSGRPLDEIRIAPAPKPGSELGSVPASTLADELLGRLRAADDEVRRLRAELEDAKRQLSQPDYSLAAHGVEPSMVERWESDRLFREAQESPE